MDCHNNVPIIRNVGVSIIFSRVTNSRIVDELRRRSALGDVMTWIRFLSLQAVCEENHHSSVYCIHKVPLMRSLVFSYPEIPIKQTIELAVIWDVTWLMWRHFNETCFNFNPAWISNYINHKVWDKITYLFSNSNGCTVEVRERISNFIPHFTRHVNTYACLD